MCLKNNRFTTSIKEFEKATTMMNFMIIIQFFEVKCIDIFNYFLTIRSIKNNLFRLVSTYFGILETNSWEILYLYYFI